MHAYRSSVATGRPTGQQINVYCFPRGFRKETAQQLEIPTYKNANKKHPLDNPLELPRLFLEYCLEFPRHVCEFPRSCFDMSWFSLVFYGFPWLFVRFSLAFCKGPPPNKKQRTTKNNNHETT